MVRHVFLLGDKEIGIVISELNFLAIGIVLDS